MRTVVCVPFRGGDSHRDAAWGFAKRNWQDWDLPVYQADVAGAFGPARIRNAAAAAAGNWDVAIFADADIVLESRSQALDAVAAAADTRSYVCAYDRLCYLDETATAPVLAGGQANPDAAYHSEVGVWISVFVISRPFWDELGGFNESYRHFDGEDIGFINTVGEHGGTFARVPGVAFHLFHPPRPSKLGPLVP